MDDLPMGPNKISIQYYVVSQIKILVKMFLVNANNYSLFNGFRIKRK